MVVESCSSMVDVRWILGAFVVTAAAAAACTTTTEGIPGGGGSSSTDAASGAGGSSADTPSGAYWSWDTVQTWTMTDEGGYATEEFRYFFWVFDPSGFAYVGPPTPDFADTACPASREDAKGKPECVPYAVANGVYTVELKEPVTLKQGTSSGPLARNELRAVPSLAGLTLGTTYESYSCYLSSCSQAEITFAPDGRYRLARANIYRGRLGDVFTNAAGSASEVGTYAIGAQSLVFTTSSGSSSTVFFFRDTSDNLEIIQVADTWFLKK